MSLADNKRNIFTTIGSYTSLMEEGKQPIQTDLFSSINNKKDIVPFLLDVLKVVAGTVALKEIIGGMFTKLIDDVEPQLKQTLTKQFIQSNSDEILPVDFVSNGINIPVKDIDVNGKFKVDPASSTGSLIYNTTPDSNFDIVARTAIQNAGNDENFSNLTLNYDATSDKLRIKPTVGSISIGVFFSTFIADAVLIDKKEITTKVMDSLYGTIASKEKKTVEENYNELKTGLLLQQVLNDDDSFTIPPEDLDRLLKKAQELSDGIVNYNMGCGLMSAELDFDDLNNMIKSVSGSTDPFEVGNQFEATIEQSTSGSTISQAASEKNKETIRDGFFQKIINIFTIELLGAVTTAPQVRVLFGMMSSLQNNGVVKLDSPTEDMSNFKTTINCMAKEIMKLVAAFIFALVVVYLIKLLKPVIIKVTKEKINQFVGIIKSLTSVNKLI